MRVKNVIFYNHYHNGDVHLSREMVRQIIKAKPDLNYSYSHRNDKGLLLDLGIKHDPQFVNTIKPKPPSKIIGDTAHINTWYGTDNRKYLIKYDISFDCLYHIFQDNYRMLGLDITKYEPQYLLPKIDFSYYKINEIDKFIDKNKDTKKIIISNGEVKSGQAENFPMAKIVNQLAAKNKDIIFFITNAERNPFAKLDNLFYTPNIIKKKGSDLNENAYLSTFCNLIIGRGSGVYTYAYIQDNLIERAPTFICFHRQIPGLKDARWLNNVFSQTMPYKAKFINSKLTKHDRVCNTIQQQINKL